MKLGMVIGICGILLAGIALFRAISSKSLKQFPLFFSYVTYVFCGSILLYGVHWLDPLAYPPLYWLYFLVSILVEFSVLVEISDHIFKNLPALRHLGRAITIVISAVLALFYILPVILWSLDRPPALLGFALRASVTKVIVLAVLFLVARHYRLELGKNVAGLMLGFSIYLGVNVANLAASVAYGFTLYNKVLWIMSPMAFTLCLLVWTIALWNLVPEPNGSIVSPVGGRDSKVMALELARFNNVLSKLIEK
jgi:hypothetical protein